MNLGGEAFEIPQSGSSETSSGLEGNDYKSPLSYLLASGEFRNSPAARFLARLIKEAADQKLRASRDNSSELSSIGLEQLTKRSKHSPRRKDDDPDGKRAGDRRCLYHAVNCW